ncbi:hypothetical protein K501DRAFT_332814 [Backusella circina FSU 941]|nr:hypothetical protein K501DRAFT_332814 [Backusella circina FSU 941]
MVRSVILVSIVAFYLSLSVVDAQKPEVSDESITNLLSYLKEHHVSQETVKAAAAENLKYQPEAADQANPANNDGASANEADNTSNDVTEQDAAQDAPPAEEGAAVEKAAVEEAAAIKEQENEMAKANSAKEERVRKGNTRHQGGVSEESTKDPMADSLRESLHKTLRQSMRESMKGSQSSKDGTHVASFDLAQTNRGNAANGPKNQGVILAGEASSDHPGEGLNNATDNTSLPSNSTMPQGAEPTNAPITNYDMSVTSGMILTNGGSIMSASSASMSAPTSSGTPNPSSKSSSSTTSSRPSATSTSAAHSGGNTSYNDYNLMFIGFTIFMSNMITIGFFW